MAALGGGEVDLIQAGGLKSPVFRNGSRTIVRGSVVTVCGQSWESERDLDGLAYVGPERVNDILTAWRKGVRDPPIPYARTLLRCW